MSDADDRAAIERVAKLARPCPKVFVSPHLMLSPTDRDRVVSLALEALENRADAQRWQWWRYRNNSAEIDPMRGMTGVALDRRVDAARAGEGT